MTGVYTYPFSGTIAMQAEGPCGRKPAAILDNLGDRRATRGRGNVPATPNWSEKVSGTHMRPRARAHVVGESLDAPAERHGAANATIESASPKIDADGSGSAFARAQERRRPANSSADVTCNQVATPLATKRSNVRLNAARGHGQDRERRENRRSMTITSRTPAARAQALLECRAMRAGDCFPQTAASTVALRSGLHVEL